MLSFWVLLGSSWPRSFHWLALLTGTGFGAREQVELTDSEEEKMEVRAWDKGDAGTRSEELESKQTGCEIPIQI